MNTEKFKSLFVPILALYFVFGTGSFIGLKGRGLAYGNDPTKKGGGREGEGSGRDPGNNRSNGDGKSSGSQSVSPSQLLEQKIQQRRQLREGKKRVLQTAIGTQFPQLLQLTGSLMQQRGDVDMGMFREYGCTEKEFEKQKTLATFSPFKKEIGKVVELAQELLRLQEQEIQEEQGTPQRCLQIPRIQGTAHQLKEQQAIQRNEELL
ncbi:hypothetical protein FACS1894152_0010 [Bacilli bacterium]|nr:hypothetical protein FACS1894152_0010 [Bacilli bacterium]